MVDYTGAHGAVGTCRFTFRRRHRKNWLRFGARDVMPIVASENAHVDFC